MTLWYQLDQSIIAFVASDHGLHCLPMFHKEDVTLFELTGWVFVKLSSSDPYIALFDYCSNGFGPLLI